VYTAPVWTSGLAALSLREPLTRVGLASACAAVVGVALVARARATDADGGRGGLVGSALSLASALTLAAMVVATRAIGTRMDSVALTAWLGVSMSAVGALLVYATDAPLAPAGARAADWAALLAAALVSLGANVLLNWGLQRIEAGPGNVIASLEVLFAYAYQLVLLRTPSSAVALVGTAVIVASALGATLTSCATSRAPRAKGGVAGSRPPVPMGACRRSQIEPMGVTSPTVTGAMR
jgi:drug/metabolite transporter (DMT)-like permease